ncbi:MAG TPA: hypothetical protein GXX51_04840 [Firmicutes bacterium]|nr:hypothetical protein [Bacillota bacterium]
MKMNRIVASMVVVCLLVLMLGVAGTCFALQGSDTGTDPYDAVFTSNIITAFPDLNLSAEAIQELRSRGTGWGEITIAASLASASGKTLDEIIVMADSGLGWGEMAKTLGVEPKSLGHAVSEVIGGAKPGHVDKSTLENAAISSLLDSNFGLEDSEVAALARSGIKKQDILMALSAAAATGDPNMFDKALALRQESRNWNDVFQALDIDPKGVRDMKTVMERSEIKDRLRERVRDLQKGPGNQALDEDENNETQKQEGVMDDKDDNDDKGDQKLEDDHGSDKDKGKNMGAGHDNESGEKKNEKREERDNERARHKNKEKD